LDPGWTKYDRHALYVGFDVTHNLNQGNNCIGVELGNGFFYQPRERYRKLTGAYGYPKMICRLLIEYSDGSIANIISDASWKADASPTIFPAFMEVRITMPIKNSVGGINPDSKMLIGSRHC